MTPSELQHLRELCERATPGPWTVDDDEPSEVCEGDTYKLVCRTLKAPQAANSAFIAAARSAVPALIEEVDRLTSALAEAERERDETQRDLADAHGELVGLRVSEGFFRNRADVLEASTVRTLSQRERESMQGCCPLCALSPHDYLAESERQAQAARRTADEYAKDASQLRAQVADLTRERDTAVREVDRWRHGKQIEGDYVCPADMERDRLRALLGEACEIGQRHTRALRSIMPKADRIVADDDRITAITKEVGIDV